MVGFGERLLYFSCGAIAGIAIVRILQSSGSTSERTRKPVDRMKPLELRKELKKAMGAYSKMEYYGVAASLRDILWDDLNRDGTEKQRPVAASVLQAVEKRLNLEVEKRLNLSPADAATEMADAEATTESNN